MVCNEKMKIENKVRKIREQMGMSVSELARRANATRQTITNIELHGQMPSGILMINIANALSKDPRDIFFVCSVTQEVQNDKKT